MEFIAAIESAGPGATKYVQGHLTPLDGDVTKLEVRLGDKGYDAVVEEAPVTPGAHPGTGYLETAVALGTHVRRRLENFVVAPGNNKG